MLSVRAYDSQFHNPDSTEPPTPISAPDFAGFLEARAREFGHRIGVTFGEAFTAHRTMGVKSLFDLL